MARCPREKKFHPSPRAIFAKVEILRHGLPNWPLLFPSCAFQFGGSNGGVGKSAPTTMPTTSLGKIRRNRLRLRPRRRLSGKDHVASRGIFFLGHLAFSCDISAAKLPAACGDQPTFGLDLIKSLDDDLSLESRRALSRRMAAPIALSRHYSCHPLAEVTWPPVRQDVVSKSRHGLRNADKKADQLA